VIIVEDRESAGRENRCGLTLRSKWHPYSITRRLVEGRTARSATPPMCDFITAFSFAVSHNSTTAIGSRINKSEFLLQLFDDAV
jgi:hypothetical protein